MVSILPSYRYKDIGELMKRCETLIATRDNLSSNRDKIRNNIQQEEEALAQFKEEQNAKILGNFTKILFIDINVVNPKPAVGLCQVRQLPAISKHFLKSMDLSPVYVPLSRFYPNFILILS